MKIRKSVPMVLLSFVVLGVLFGYAMCTIDASLLWTTNAAGLTEINEFLVGDPVYLRTNPGLSYPLPYNSKYTVYIFEGSFVPAEGEGIPGARTPLGLTPLDVITDSNGQFGPTLIWDHAAFGEYTIILDCLIYRGDPAMGIGVYNEVYDYRDDLCTAVPTPPSFHVIPEVGTIVLLASMFGSLGYFVVRKRKKQNHA